MDVLTGGLIGARDHIGMERGHAPLLCFCDWQNENIWMLTDRRLKIWISSQEGVFGLNAVDERGSRFDP